MISKDRIDIACKILMDFANRTSLIGIEKPKRYLWTDAFAVCNFLALHKFTNNEKYLDLALKLIDQVHHVLGKHRGDDGRVGWISGLSNEEAEKHPTIGGLRIGKKLPERKHDEPLDWNLEWDRDGQYYHYLTKWMHTLNKVFIVTKDEKYLAWAIELAKKAHSAFTYTTPEGKRKIYWKMSIDLTRALVESMGQHDPLDGYITYNEIQILSLKLKDLPILEEEIKDIFEIMKSEEYWVTNDPLGIGELLSSAYKVAELISIGSSIDIELLLKVLKAAYISLEVYLREGVFSLPAQYRLPFREFGLSIGLKATVKMRELIDKNEVLNVDEVKSLVKLISSYIPIAEKIENFWLEDKNRKSRTWKEHRDINEVMLVTSLIPNGYIGVYINE
ncbi:MAG: hypothetical protein NZ926_00400 [Candidatus Methanomethylicia archaeon]|nr:hypothetical protein [Candidatus Methanomethylicia archaeon]MCX8168895.1 hypothetical protein [Candidatus Methanomethylicia archaeon]MDW7988627.1 hypothetical protein [Nitrososphaerota archaeon]